MRVLPKTLVLSLALTALVGPARAGLVLQAEGFTAQAGSTGSFLVTLTNDDPIAEATLAAYQIQLTTDVPGLTFTGVEQAPMDYVFPGTTGPISTDFGPPKTLFTALDLSANDDGFDVLGAGLTYGVLLVSYAVDLAAPGGTGHVSFVSPGAGDADLTQLADGDFNLVDFTAIDGPVRILAVSAVPEPPGMAVLPRVLAVVLVRAGAQRLARQSGGEERATRPR